jgi:hypothetical protein
MKTVFTSNELPHVWAHQRAPKGRAPSAMSFDGPDFRSYSTTIALLTRDGSACWLNTRRYSNTTSKHQSAVRQALPRTVRTFAVPFAPAYDAAANVDRLLDAARSEGDTAADIRATHPRRKSQIVEHAARCESLLATAREACEFFGITRDCSHAALDTLRETIRQRQAAAAALAAKEARKRERLARAALREWLAGEDVSIYRLPSMGGAFLRVKGGNVETSKGVSIPLEEARAALAFVQSKRAEGWHRNGSTYPIAGYQLDAVNSEGVVAGCHRITWKELQRFAATLAK